MRKIKKKANILPAFTYFPLIGTKMAVLVRMCYNQTSYGSVLVITGLYVSLSDSVCIIFQLHLKKKTKSQAIDINMLNDCYSVVKRHRTIAVGW